MTMTETPTQLTGGDTALDVDRLEQMLEDDAVCIIVTVFEDDHCPNPVAWIGRLSCGESVLVCEPHHRYLVTTSGPEPSSGFLRSGLRCPHGFTLSQDIVWARA